jgi:hypothetical protein
MTQASGVDISVWQDQNSTPQMYDPWKTRQMGGSFVGIKVSQSNWADPDYIMNWSNCKNVLYEMPFHFLVWETNAKRQAEAYWGLLEKNISHGILDLAVDFEWWNTVPSGAIQMLYDFQERMKVLSAPLPLAIYTAKSFWTQYGSTDPYWKQYELWLCDINGPVEVPKPWDTFNFHQYTFKLDGLAWGAESLDLDGDYYNGTVQDMMTKYNLPYLQGMSGSPITPPIPPVTTTQKWGTVVPNTTLNFRPQPSTTPDTYVKVNGQVFGGFTSEIFDESVDAKGRTWYQMGVKGWACAGDNGYTYITTEEKPV